MKPLKILIISTFFPPLNSIASLRPYAWAKYWSQIGHEVTILTTEKEEDPDTMLSLSASGFKTIEVPYPQWIKNLRHGYKTTEKTSAPIKKNKCKQWVKDIFHYLRFKKGILHACRMPDITDFWAGKAYAAIKTHGPWDFVISTAGPYTTHLIGYKLKKNQFVKHWIADYRDTWSNNYIYKGIFPFNVVEGFLEKHILRKADLITTISAPFAQSIAKEFSHSNVHVIENGFDPEDLKHLSADSIFPSNQKFRIVHTGSIYKGRRDPTQLFQAIQKIYHSDQRHLLQHLEVLFIGPNQADLQQMIKHHQVEEWVKMMGFVKREDALKMQRDAHALLFLPWNDSSVDGVMTGKLFEYLFSGTPIIAVGAQALEDSQRLILSVNAGEVFFSVEEIEKYLLQHLQDRQKIKTSLSAEILERYTRKFQAEQLLKLAENL